MNVSLVDELGLPKEKSIDKITEKIIACSF